MEGDVRKKPPASKGKRGRVTGCPEIGNEGGNVDLDDVVGNRMNGASALDFH